MILRSMNRKVEQERTEETENTKAPASLFSLLSPVRAYAVAYYVRGSWLTACAALGSPLQRFQPIFRRTDERFRQRLQRLLNITHALGAAVCFDLQAL